MLGRREILSPRRAIDAPSEGLSAAGATIHANSFGLLGLSANVSAADLLLASGFSDAATASSLLSFEAETTTLFADNFDEATVGRPSDTAPADSVPPQRARPAPTLTAGPERTQLAALDLVAAQWAVGGFAGRGLEQAVSRPRGEAAPSIGPSPTRLTGLPEAARGAASVLVDGTAGSLDNFADPSPSLTATGSGSAGLLTADRAAILENLGRLPLMFEANVGQVDPRVDFLSRGLGHTLFLTSSEVVLALGTDTVMRMELLGATPTAEASGLEPLRSRGNYFIGNDPAQWHTDVPNYAKVYYEGIYPGVDLVFYGTDQGGLEYDFIVAPGGDPGVIQMNFPGASRVDLDHEGRLWVEVNGVEFIHNAPTLFQETTKGKDLVTGTFVLNSDHRVGFQVGLYDPAKPLVIDPVVTFSSYFGGQKDDVGRDIDIDQAGVMYITGYTESLDFESTVSHPPHQSLNLRGTRDAFVTAVAPGPGASEVIYNTYIGGDGADEGHGITVRKWGDFFATCIAGQTASNNFPVLVASQSTYGGNQDAFVSFLDQSGHLYRSTYLGGNQADAGFDIVAFPDPLDVVYVTGFTESQRWLPNHIPGLSPNEQPSNLSGPSDAFVAKMTDNEINYFSYIGGLDHDAGHAIAVDSSGRAYITGATDSGNSFHTFNRFDAEGAGFGDAFISVLVETGNAFLYSSLISGTGLDRGEGISVTPGGMAAVTGFTSSADFETTANAFDRTYNNPEAFVLWLGVGGMPGNPVPQVLYRSYLGGGDGESGWDVALDEPSGYLVITGETNSNNFPLSPNALQNQKLGVRDAFVTVLNPSQQPANQLVFSTYLGAAHFDANMQQIGETWSYGLVLTGSTIHLVGTTNSPALDEGGLANNGALVNPIPNHDNLKGQLDIVLATITELWQLVEEGI